MQPFGDQRGDMRNALLCMLVDKLHYWLGGKKSPHTMVDFLPFTDLSAAPESKAEPEPEPEQEPERKGARISAELLTQLFLVSAVERS